MNSKIFSIFFALVITLTIVLCETPERQPKQKSPNNKQVCRYNKGPWSDCVNGEKSRTDTLKIPTPGCEATRPATKKCRPACRYSKGEWTPCENGEKKRTLTRLEGDGPDCPATKAVSKQCSPQAKKTKQPRNKNRKTNSSSITPSQAY
ncbi:uncharacterized protein LOC107360426 isoform X2 [Tetranychus urticae]|uniref:uncharacterized protein LOC107360426 isoform X2 n=1 Tax=Tetranychus urticae TaxID=32264 RepID=UPI00077BD8B6|nr:uncharacterized protein LOC107360426 isoform X2 [Tetranychus urticae]